MDTISIATAIATIVMTKMLEKTGEAVNEELTTNINELLKKIRTKAPETASAIESANQQTGDLVKVVHEFELIAQSDEEFAQQLNHLGHLVREELLAVDLKEREEPILFNSKPTIPIEKFADKVGVYVTEGATVNIENLNF